METLSLSVDFISRQIVRKRIEPKTDGFLIRLRTEERTAPLLHDGKGSAGVT